MSKNQMKPLYLVLFAVSFLHASRAADVEKMYYVGEAKLSNASGQPRGSQAFLLEKIHDPDQSTIVERAVIATPEKSVEQHTMTMKVKGDTFTVSDDRDSVHGSGTLFGPAWHWTYFKATCEGPGGVRIEDENYMTDPGVLVAHKKISAPDGTVVMYMDITLKLITAPTFNILSESLLKKGTAAATEKKP